MKKWTLLLVLVLCMTFIMPASLAEAAYTPGTLSDQLVLDAITGGKMVGGTMTLVLDLDEDMLASSEEEKEQIRLLEETLANACLTGAFGVIGDALRLEAGAIYATETDSASASIAADVTLDGLSVESDLIPGEKVTATWETILALCGMSQSDIAMIMSLKEIDIEAVMTQLIAQIEPVMQMAAQYAAPYGQTFIDFFATLPMEIEENLPADENYPAAAERVTIAVTAQDVGRLLTALADQLEQDAALAPIVDLALQEAAAQSPETAIRSTAELCAQVRALAAQMTDATPYIFTLALDESGMPAYIELYDATEDDSGFYVGFQLYPGEEPNSTVASLIFYTAAAGGEPIASVSAAVLTTVDPEDVNNFDAYIVMDVSESETTLMSMEMSMASYPAETEDSLPAYAQDIAMTMTINDGAETVAAQATGSASQQMTAEGGEYIVSVSEMTMDVAGEQVNQTSAEELLIYPTEDGFAGSMTTMQQMPEEGVTLAAVMDFGSWTHEPAALTELALENATNDDMNALITRITENGTAQLTKLMGLLPAEVVNMLSE